MKTERPGPRPLAALMLGAVVAAHGVAHAAEAYPSKPLRMIVPFPPGGGNDILARAIGQRLAEIVGQQVVVDNRGGAGGLIGATTAATAAPDGYTLFLGSVGNLAHSPALNPKLPYDPLRDFQPVTLLVNSPFVMAVNNSVAAKNAKELIALARAKPGAINYASAGPGSSLHMAAELFKYAAKIDIVHVAYKGAAPAMTDLIGGQVQMIVSTPAPVVPQIRSGKLRGVGVTSLKRSAALPDVPTVAESALAGFEVLSWQGVAVPKKTPDAIVQKLNADLVAALKRPGLSDSLGSQGLDAVGDGPKGFAALIESEIRRYRDLVRSAGIKAD